MKARGGVHEGMTCAATRMVHRTHCMSCSRLRFWIKSQVGWRNAAAFAAENGVGRYCAGVDVGFDLAHGIGIVALRVRVEETG